MSRRSIASIQRDEKEQENEHERQQNWLNFKNNIKIIIGWCVFLIFLAVTILSIIGFSAYFLKSPYISEKAVDLLINAWTYIVTLIVGNILPSFGLKNSKD